MTPRTRAPGYRPDIQGLRAVAVLGVLAYHAGLPFFGGGYLGVDVFFVISGYLIGGQLLRELAKTGRVDFASFSSRRARRVLPASLVVIALTVIATLALTAPLRAPDIAVDAIWAALSAANIRFALQGTDYLAGKTPSPLQHYWSLGVEEQFYILVPIVLLGLFVLVRRRRRRQGLLLLGGVLLVGASFLVCLLWGSSSPWTYFTIPARAWELGVGVLAAGLASRAARCGSVGRQAMAAAGALALVACGWLGGLPGFPHPGVGTLVPVFATAALLLAGEPSASPRPLVTRALGVRPAQFIGALSFSLYLVHWPVLALAQENSNSELPLPMPVRLGLALASFPLAVLLWRYVEQPFLRRKVDPAHTRRPLIIAGTAIGALVLSLSVAMPALASRPLDAARYASPSIEYLPLGTSYVPSNLRPALATSVSDTGALYTDGCQQGTSGRELKVCSFGPPDGPTVVLFGDSHAGRWFPALRAALNGTTLRLVTLTKSGCRSLETATLWAGAENRSCADWRSAAVDWLHQHPPQLIVLADHLGRSAESATAVSAHWRAATLNTLGRLPGSVPVAILSETPEFDFSPPACLSRHLNDARACSEARAVAVNAPVINGVRAGAAEGGASFLDMTDWFCNDTDCPTIIGSTLVYTDEHHLSATYSARLGPAISSKVEPLLESLAKR